MNLGRVELHPHQEKAVKDLANGKILVGDVGVGKSLTAAAYYVYRESPKDVYVITTAKKRNTLEWEDEFINFTVGKTKDTTLHGVLTVDSWENIGKYIDVTNSFFIFDEQRLVGSGAWVKAFYKIAKNNTWVVLSATPGDVWLDYVPIFVANGFYKNKTDFTMNHVVWRRYGNFQKVERYIGTAKLMKLRESILVDMPYHRRTFRHLRWEHVEYDQEALHRVTRKRWNIFEERPVQDIAEVYRLARMIVNSDARRLEKVRELSLVHPRLIIFYNFSYELDALRTLISDGDYAGVYKNTVIAEYNGERHDPVPEAERWIYLVQYAAGAEGWNCITTDTMVFYSLPYSYKRWHQAFGRIDRLNNIYLDLYYYILSSDSWIDRAIRSSLKQKKSFHEKALKL